MHGKTYILGIAILVSVCSLGCKSASKLAWWKSAEDAQAEAAVMAHSAPTLPSEIAKQAEMAATNVDITPGVTSTADSGTAAPFVPTNTTPQSAPAVANIAPPAYPSTGASSFTSAPSPQNASPTQTTATNVAATAMPYDPQAVPASNAGPTGAAAAQNASLDNRYGTPPATSVYQSAGNRYANTTAAPVSNSEQVAPTGTAPAAAPAQTAQVTTPYSDDRLAGPHTIRT